MTMRNVKVFGSVCILAFVLLAAASANNNTTTVSPTTTGAATTASTTAASTTAASTTAVPTQQTRVEMTMRVTSENFTVVKNISHGKGKEFKKKLEKTISEHLKAKGKPISDVVVTGVKKGSVIVEYYLVINTTSEAEAANIANALIEEIKSGKIGNYTTDPTYTTDAYIVRKVKASDVSKAPSDSTTTPDQVVTTTQSRIDLVTKVTSVNYERDITKDLGKAFADSFRKTVLEHLKAKGKPVSDVVVTGVKEGSVIVEYYLVINTTSEAEAANIANALIEQIKSGKIGNYTTDPSYKTDAYIVRKVKASDVSKAPSDSTTTVSTELLIILGVALFILLVIIIVLIVLIFCLLKLKKKGE